MGDEMSRERGRKLSTKRPVLPGVLATAGILAIVVSLAIAGQRRSLGVGSARVAAVTGQPALHVIPFPNTPDASTQSQIIFSSLKPSDLAGPPVVVGSSSHAHTGQLKPLPGNAGTAFVPATPFTPGETVTVQAALTSTQAGDTAGDPGSQHLHWSFTVALPPPSSGASSTRSAGSSTGGGAAPFAPTGVPRPGTTTNGRQTTVAPPGATAARSAPRPVFHSEPGLHPPQLHVSAGPAPGSADIFVTPLSRRYRGLMILNHRGQLLWFHPVTNGALGSDLAVQTYRQRRVLTYEQGNWVDGHGVNVVDRILDSSYRPIATVRAGWGYTADLHEFQLGGHGTALLDAYVPVQTDLSSVGGPTNGVIYDCVIQRVDVRTGKVLWEWHALGHVPLADSYSNIPKNLPFDYFHINSIQQLPNHRLLISARNTWAVYLIDERTGAVLWTLGGKSSTFTMPKRARFEWQHDARLLPNHLLTVFDDANYPQEEPQSSAKVLRVDTGSDTVALVKKYTHAPPLLASYEGSAQLLPNGDVFVGWGDASSFSEYKPGGHQVFNASFPIPDNTYRAYRFAWRARPITRPAVALSRSGHGATWLYASWNGATQVAKWQVLGGSVHQTLTPLEVKPWRGFETAILLHTQARYIAVQALNAYGHVLGRSRTVLRPGS